MGDPAQAAATPPAGPVAAEPSAEAKIELTSIEAPHIAPETPER